MSGPQALIEEAFAALHRDLVNESGPQISTMRNYRFAIVPYSPDEEFKLRRAVQKLTTDLKGNGWVVLTLSLQKLLIDRIRREFGEDGVLDRMAAMERRVAEASRERGLVYLRDKVSRVIEGPDGIAADMLSAQRAEHEGIAIICSPLSAYEIAGIMHKAGIQA